MNREFKDTFTLKGELLKDEIINRIEEGIQPYLKDLDEAKIYETKKKREVYSEKRQKSFKSIIDDEDLRLYIIDNILPLINEEGKKYGHLFEVLPMHMDYIEYVKNGFFEEHIDFINNHTNFTQQYTCIIGLENCLSGSTYVWDTEEEKYNNYYESIMRGGLMWFKSDLRHFSEKFEDSDNKKKRIFTFSLRAIKRDYEEELDNFYKIKSKNGKEYYLEKKRCKNTLFEELNKALSEEGSNSIETQLEDEELKLMIDYLNGGISEELNKEEMIKINEKLALYMIIPSEYKNCKLSSRIMKELNERNEKSLLKDYIYFDKFEPWMVEWAKEMNYIPFQVVYHWNDITEYLQVSVEYSESIEDGYPNHQHGQFLRREMKKKISGEKDYGKKIYKQLDIISPYYEIDKNLYEYNSYTIMNDNLEMEKQWCGSDYTIMYGNCQYLDGHNILGKMCKKMNNNDKMKNKTTVNKMKNLIHFHMYNLFKFNLEEGYKRYKKYWNCRSEEELKRNIKYGDYYSCLLGLENPKYKEWRENHNSSESSLSSSLSSESELSLESELSSESETKSDSDSDSDSKEEYDNDNKNNMKRKLKRWNKKAKKIDKICKEKEKRERE